MKAYNHQDNDPKWQKKWEENRLYETPLLPNKKKVYVLDMFPYPSGEGLHVGHPKGYIATDIYSRFKRMSGYDVLHPMGWDAFGLPAEQFALKNKLHPKVAVEKNIANFKSQLSHIGLDYDWKREINTTDPAFYKWTQWIFTKLYEKGLAYESNEPINWCPSCKTGLANEDVNHDGTCERCDTKVEKKPIRQWVLKITQYADRMLKDLDTLNWPEGVKTAQKNWIGRSEGAEFEFEVTFKNGGKNGKIPIFTTRADTMYGATCMILSPEHLFVTLSLDDNHKGVLDNRDEVKKYVDNAKSKSQEERIDTKKEKTGVELKGVKAINPVTKEEIPVFVADYVLGGIGTGAIMAVPAHDDRDFEFAKKYNVPIKEVVRPYVIDHVNVPREDKKTKVRTNVHAIVYDPKIKKYLIIRNSIHKWDTVIIGGVEAGEDVIEAAKRELREETGYVDVAFKRILGNPVQAGYFAPHKDENRIAISSAVYFELVSDKREVIATDGENEGNEVLWVSESEFVPGKMINSELSLWLARLKSGEDIAYTDEGVVVNSGEYDGKSSREVREKIIESCHGKKVVKYKIQDWTFARQRYWGEPFPVVRDKNGKVYMVDESELPVLLPEVESYEPTGTGESPLAAIETWVNVMGYITDKGTFKQSVDGEIFTRETNTMPQWAGSSWYYLRFADPHNDKALISPEIEKAMCPVDVYVGGDHATRHLIYARFWHKFLYDIGVVSTIEPFSRLEFLGFILAEDGRKMSKRWGNVINPDDVINEYGADTLRVYEMFMAPFEQTASWSTTSIKGADKFLDRIYLLQKKIGDTSTITYELHKTIKKVTEDIENFKFNTAVSQMMILVNAMEGGSFTKEDYTALLQILAPFAPHITEQIWHELGNTTSIHASKWPEFDASKLVQNEVTMSIQIAGKMRGTYVIPFDSTDDFVIKTLKTLEIYKKYVGGQEPKKVIIIKNRLVNVVI